MKSLAYTRAGDAGMTSLFGLSGKLSKANLRFETIGDVDELNSMIGVCIAHSKNKEINEVLKKVQINLFKIGANLAAAKHNIKSSDVKEMEKAIDKFHAKLPVLTKFILPGGSLLASNLQLARAVCRRAERRIVALNEKEKFSPEILSYTNRLSSLLFVLARWANKQAKIKELEWNP